MAVHLLSPAFLRPFSGLAPEVVKVGRARAFRRGTEPPALLRHECGHGLWTARTAQRRTDERASGVASCVWLGLAEDACGAAEQSDEADEAFAGTIASRRCRLMPALDHY